MLVLSCIRYAARQTTPTNVFFSPKIKCKIYVLLTVSRGVTTPNFLLQASKDAKPTPPNKADIKTLACTPANSPLNPSVATTPFIAAKTGVPAGTTPVARRVFTTSKGVVSTEEIALATPPHSAY